MSIDDVIENAIEQSEWERLASDLENRPASEIAEILDRLEDPQCTAICRRLLAEKFAEIFAHFESERHG